MILITIYLGNQEAEIILQIFLFHTIIDPCQLAIWPLVAKYLEWCPICHKTLCLSLFYTDYKIANLLHYSQEYALALESLCLLM